jgi:protein translocase subunit yidC
VLPILMGLTMIAQQFISPSPEKSQNLIMYISAVIFTFLFANFPSGLVLYWTFNNIISLAQSYIIKKLTTKPQTKHTKGKKK